MSARPPTVVLSFAGVEFVPAELRLRRDGGRWVDLQPKVSRALEVLAGRAGQIVTKEELLDLLWPDAIVNEETLTQTIRRLRRVLGDDAREPRFVQTVATRGYRLLPAVATAEPSPEQLAVRRERSTTRVAALLRAILDTGGQPPPAPAETRPVPPEEVAARAREALRSRRPAITGKLAAGGVAVVLALAGALALVRLGRAPRPLTADRAVAHRLTVSATPKQDLAAAADGRTLAFAAVVPGEDQLDLYLLLPEGGAETRLTATAADEYGPQLSAPGDAVVFGRLARGGGSEAASMAAAGGDERILVRDAWWPAPAPSGRELAFARRSESGWRIVVRRLQDGAEWELGAAAGPPASLRYSPDGKRLAYTDGRALVILVVGRDSRTLAVPGGRVSGLAWEPLSGAVLVGAGPVGSGEVWRIPTSGAAAGAVTTDTPGAAYPVPAVDGRRIAFLQGPGIAACRSPELPASVRAGCGPSDVWLLERAP